MTKTLHIQIGDFLEDLRDPQRKQDRGHMLIILKIIAKNQVILHGVHATPLYIVF